MIRSALAAAFCILLTACAPSLVANAPPPLAVNLSALRTCERILHPVPLPTIKPTDDARDAFTKSYGTLEVASYEIDKGRGCVASVRHRYAAPKKRSFLTK